MRSHTDDTGQPKGASDELGVSATSSLGKLAPRAQGRGRWASACAIVQTVAGARVETTLDAVGRSRRPEMQDLVSGSPAVREQR